MGLREDNLKLTLQRCAQLCALLFLFTACSESGTSQAPPDNPTQPGTSDNSDVAKGPTADKKIEVVSHKPKTPTIQAPPSIAILKETVREPVALAQNAPFYEMDLRFEVPTPSYWATQRLTYTNNTGTTLKDLAFLLYPNSTELVENGASNLTMKSIKIKGKDVFFKQTGPMLSVTLPTPLAPGKTVVVESEFMGVVFQLKKGATNLEKMAMEQIVQLLMGGDGDAKGGYGVYSYGQGITSLALWYPILVAHGPDGWDMKEGSTMGDISHFSVSNYDVRVTVPRGVRVTATGVDSTPTTSLDGGTHRYRAGAVREFTVQASRHYEVAEAEMDNVKLRSWFLKDHRRSGELVLSYAQKALAVFSHEFGPYPYTELDLAEAPLVGGAGGVEFPGLVTIASMFYADSGNKNTNDFWSKAMSSGGYMRDTLEFVVAHEVAHQWWNAVVGSDSKRHPFVDEALANHSAILYFERVHGPAAAEKQRELQLRLPYQIAMMTGSSDRPVDLPTDQYKNSMEYAAIVYGKGGLFFEELRTLLGDKHHFAWLKAYYEKHKFKVAKNEDLIASMVNAAPDKAKTKALIQRWLHESHGAEDIGSMNVAKVAKSLLGDEVFGGAQGDMLELLSQGGNKQIEQLVRQLLSSDGSLKDGFDYKELLKNLGPVVGGDLQDFTRMFKQYERLFKVYDRVMKGQPVSTDELMKISKDLMGKDPETRKLIDAAEILLKKLNR